MLCVYKYRDPQFDHDYLLNLLQTYIRIEKKTVRQDETLETELRVLEMMVHKAKRRRRHLEVRGVLQARPPSPPPPVMESRDATWSDMTGTSLSQVSEQSFMFPAEWDSTASALPESSDKIGWLNLMQYVDDVEDSPEVGVTTMSSVS